jgi:hypothetical protein
VGVQCRDVRDDAQAHRCTPVPSRPWPPRVRRLLDNDRNGSDLDSKARCGHGTGRRPGPRRPRADAGVDALGVRAPPRGRDAGDPVGWDARRLFTGSIDDDLADRWSPTCSPVVLIRSGRPLMRPQGGPVLLRRTGRDHSRAARHGGRQSLVPRGVVVSLRRERDRPGLPPGVGEHRLVSAHQPGGARLRPSVRHPRHRGEAGPATGPTNPSR